VFRGAPFVAFACYLTVSAIVPVLTNDPLPLAFLADLIGGAFVLPLASFIINDIRASSAFEDARKSPFVPPAATD
jgi:formate hydrogenlyase subunit 4